MIRLIRQLGDPVLKARALPVATTDLGGEPLVALARDMAETLAHAGGVGLAAPQVGVSLRIILAGSFPSERFPDRPHVPVFPLVTPPSSQPRRRPKPAGRAA